MALALLPRKTAMRFEDLESKPSIERASGGFDRLGKRLNAP